MGIPTAVRFNTGPQGTAVSVANAGLSAAPFLNGGSAVFDTAAAGEGTYGLTVTSSAGLTAVVKVPMQGTSAVGEWTATEATIHTPTVTPNVDSTILQLRNLENSVVVARLYYSTTGQLYIRGQSDSTSVTLMNSVPLNTQYDIAWLVKIATTTAESGFKASLYVHAGRTGGTAATATANRLPTADGGAGYSLGTNVPNEWGLGVMTVLTAAVTHKYDTLRAETARSTELGVYTPPSNNPPTLAVIAEQSIALGASTTFTAVATDSDGTVASTGGHAWTVVSYSGTTAPTLTNTSNATVTVNTAPMSVAGDVVLQDVATDNGGATSNPRQVTLHVTAVAGSAVNPNRVVSNPGAWGYGGTATDLVDGMSDTGEWILTATAPSGAIIVAGFPALPANDVVIDFYVDLLAADGTTLAAVGQTGSIDAQFFAGTVAISDVVSQTVSRTEAHVVITLTSAQNAAFTAAGRTDPRVQLTATAS